MLRSKKLIKCCTLVIHSSRRQQVRSICTSLSCIIDCILQVVSVVFGSPTQAAIYNFLILVMLWNKKKFYGGRGGDYPLFFIFFYFLHKWYLTIFLLQYHLFLSLTCISACTDISESLSVRTNISESLHHTTI